MSAANTYDEVIRGGALNIRDEDKIAYYGVDENGVIILIRRNGHFGGLATDLKWCEENLRPISEFPDKGNMWFA